MRIQIKALAALLVCALLLPLATACGAAEPVAEVEELEQQNGDEDAEALLEPAAESDEQPAETRRRIGERPLAASGEDEETLLADGGDEAQSPGTTGPNRAANGSASGSGGTGASGGGYTFQVEMDGTMVTAYGTLPVDEESSTAMVVADTVTYDAGVDYDITNEVIRLVNVQRQRNGKDTLATDSGLMRAAAVRAEELETLYSHTRPNGSSCFTAISNRGSFGGVAENICMGYATADKIVTAFMNSDGHRKNILGGYDKVGIAVWRDESGKLYCTQLFGSTLSYNIGGGTETSQPDDNSESSTDPSQEIKQNASLSPSSLTLEVGQSASLNVHYGTANTSGYSLSYSSSGTLVDVDGSGRVTAQEPGLAVVSVSIMKGSQRIHILYCQITVVEPYTPDPEPDPNPNDYEDWDEE